MYFYCRNTSGRRKREVILIFTTANFCGATTKRQGVAPRNSPHLSTSQFVAPILRYIAIWERPVGVKISTFGEDGDGGGEAQGAGA